MDLRFCEAVGTSVANYSGTVKNVESETVGPQIYADKRGLEKGRTKAFNSCFRVQPLIRAAPR